MSNEVERWMRVALELASRGRGAVEPNPMVGCVIVKDGEVVGTGFHEKFGQAHAEVNALRRAGEAAEGADVYVSLEPCAHYGNTPPCALALIEAKVGRVFCAMQDPTEKVGGKGFDMLRSADIPVEVGCLEDEAKLLNRAWLKSVDQGLPWVTAKWASTVDGAIATQSGDSQWISNEHSRKFVHEQRAITDAVMVGIGTAVADDPLLTARDVPMHRVARRVVVDPNLQLAETSRLVETLEMAPLVVGIYQRHLEDPSSKVRAMQDKGVVFFGLEHKRDMNGLLNLKPLLAFLHEQYKTQHVFVEGGANTFAALFGQRLIDEMMVFIAPKCLGDGRGLPPLKLPPSGRGVDMMQMARHLRLLDIKRFEDDVLLHYLIESIAS